MHDGRRSECKECALARNSKWREANPEAFKSSMEKHRSANKEAILARDKEYRERNKESIKARRRAQYAANPAPHKESVKRDAAKNPERVKEAFRRFCAKNPKYKAEYNAKYYKANRAKIIALALKREAYIKQQSRIVAGLTQAHRVEVDALYDFCQIFPGHEVDHIVPIQGKCVTGLHAPWNMQILTITENRRKSNKFDANSHSLVGALSLQECIKRSLLTNI
jgi:5-methylcytosine-specific restriction endonuclease McrA